MTEFYLLGVEQYFFDDFARMLILANNELSSEQYLSLLREIEKVSKQKAEAVEMALQDLKAIKNDKP